MSLPGKRRIITVQPTVIPEPERIIRVEPMPDPAEAPTPVPEREPAEPEKVPA